MFMKILYIRQSYAQVVGILSGKHYDQIWLDNESVLQKQSMIFLRKVCEIGKTTGNEGEDGN